MRLEQLSPAPGAKRRPKRVGRGPGSGHGKTSGRGHKGQKARSGGGKVGSFEGGQMPLYRRVPKRGFTPRRRTVYRVVNLKDLQAFGPGTVVDPEQLVKARLVKKARSDRVKVLGDGELTHALTVRVHRVSASARQKIEAAGGRVEVLAP
ncbi:MAG: 50S ribosomal protein L15 [Candidatus Rokubacteria bacterium]|nr:50S ribosomal protein L15 [Candidatus Rokubacteria bacterium]